jgi:translation initiation factor 3 subunit M
MQFLIGPAPTPTPPSSPPRSDSARVTAVTRQLIVNVRAFRLDCEEADLQLQRKQEQAKKMANVHQYVFIEGSFADLAQELADFLNIGPEVTPLLEQNKKDDALKKLVTASIALNSIPEKEIQAAYNLLVYLVLQSPSVNMFLPRVCENLSKPITSSPNNGTGIALSILGTIFNLLQPDNEVRFNVFQAVLRLVKQSGSFEVLKTQLAQLDNWMKEWDIDEEDKCKMYTNIAEVAEEAGEDE